MPDAVAITPSLAQVLPAAFVACAGVVLLKWEGRPALVGWSADAEPVAAVSNDAGATWRPVSFKEIDRDLYHSPGAGAVDVLDWSALPQFANAMPGRHDHG